MSYARFSDTSDVYVYAHVGGYVECCGCLLGDKWDYHTPAEVVAHMNAHSKAGHCVPERLFDAGLYPPSDFVAMCPTFMCREPIDHIAPHTPTDERGERIRAQYV